MLILFRKTNLQIVSSLVNCVVVTSWTNILLWSFKHVFVIDIDQLVATLRILAGTECLLVHACVWVSLVIVYVFVVDSLRISVRCNWSHLYLATVHF